MKNKNNLSLALFSLLLITLSFACGDKDEDVTYTNTMRSELAGCAVSGCHDANSPVGSLANYEDTRNFIAFGRILGALRHEDGFSPMPKGGEMWSESEIDRLQTWINDDMPE